MCNIPSAKAQATEQQNANCTPECHVAVKMLRRVFQQPVAHVVVLNGVQCDGLKPPPTQRDDQRVSRLQDLFVPSMFFQSDLKGRTKWSSLGLVHRTKS